ncbi:MAG: HD domain-containing protein [Proteobacteria bacterium]|nr:HD domain-containing protein [Pseudomonadota bacterium]
MRTILHFVFSWGILSIYGGRVCPYVEGLGIGHWAVQLIFFFAAAYAVRAALLDRLLVRGPVQHRVVRQLTFDLVVFLVLGLGLMVFNSLIYRFPVSSGLKILLGSLSLGFFGAVDLALEAERRIGKEIERTRQEIMLRDRYFPMTFKFALVASFCAVAVAGVIILIVSKDLDWVLEHVSRGASAKRSVMVEIAFVTTIFLAEIFNLIYSYARNLKMFLGHENAALMDVSQGNLDSHVPVSRNDEFGFMAAYTNQMIEGLRARTEELQLTRDVTIVSLASLAETRDNETGAHILRTQRYVRALAEALKDQPGFQEVLDPATIDLLFKSAPLHDLGKVGVRDSILLKPGRHTPEEFEEMKKHTNYGRDALQTAIDRLGTNSFLMLAQEIAFTHHEKWDGSGYPRGLAGYDIPVSGRLMALADVYDALISKRVYKPAFSHEEAMGIIIEGRGVHFDPDILDAFLRIEAEFIQIAKEFADREHSKPY